MYLPVACFGVNRPTRNMKRRTRRHDDAPTEGRDDFEIRDMDPKGVNMLSTC